MATIAALKLAKKYCAIHDLLPVCPFCSKLAEDFDSLCAEVVAPFIESNSAQEKEIARLHTQIQQINHHNRQINKTDKINDLLIEDLAKRVAQLELRAGIQRSGCPKCGCDWFDTETHSNPSISIRRCTNAACKTRYEVHA